MTHKNWLIWATWVNNEHGLLTSTISKVTDHHSRRKIQLWVSHTIDNIRLNCFVPIQGSQWAKLKDYPQTFHQTFSSSWIYPDMSKMMYPTTDSSFEYSTSSLPLQTSWIPTNIHLRCTSKSNINMCLFENLHFQWIH